mgnify:CR=1 FL=1
MGLKLDFQAAAAQMLRQFQQDLYGVEAANDAATKAPSAGFSKTSGGLKLRDPVGDHQ